MKPTLKQIVADRKAATARLEAEAPILREGFGQMVAAYYKPGAMDLREKELAAISCSVALCCVPALANHIANAVDAGATREQVIEAAAIGVEFGGGAAYTVARDHLLDFLDEVAGSF